MPEIIPTNTCPKDLAELAERSRAFAAYAPQVQLDVCDGSFVPAISWPYGAGQWDELVRMTQVGEKLPHAEAVRYEAHLMIESPRACGELLAQVGVPRIMGHFEASGSIDNARETLRAWRESGAREVGLALLIDTPLERVEPLIAELDCVLLMSIEKLGAQGAAFQPRIYERIRQLHAAHPSLTVAIDGGVSEQNIAELARAGASRFGVGSAISKAADPKKAYETLFSLAIHTQD